MARTETAELIGLDATPLESMRSRFGTSRILSALLTAGILLVASGAAAGPKEARKYFKEAKSAYENGQYERAATLLEKAYSEEANLTYQYNRIRALQGAEQYEKALDVLKTYEKPMLDAKGFEDVPALKRQLQDKAGKTGSTSKASSDSAVSGPADAMTEPDRDSTPGGGGRRSDTPTMTYVGWGLAGGGILLLGTGTLYASTALLPSETKKRIDNDRDLRPSDEKAIRRQQTLSVIFLSAGTGALIGGGVILLNQMNRNGSAGGSSAANRRLRVVPWASREGAGARLRLKF